MAITAGCGPHCGIRANAEDTIRREGHCPCCHPAGAPASITAGTVTADELAGAPLITAPPGRPMCWAWYERSGGRKPWETP